MQFVRKHPSHLGMQLCLQKLVYTYVSLSFSVLYRRLRSHRHDVKMTENYGERASKSWKTGANTEVKTESQNAATTL